MIFHHCQCQRDCGPTGTGGVNTSFADIWYTEDVTPQKPSKNDELSELASQAENGSNPIFRSCCRVAASKIQSTRSVARISNLEKRGRYHPQPNTNGIIKYSTLRRGGFCVPSTPRWSIILVSGLLDDC